MDKIRQGKSVEAMYIKREGDLGGSMKINAKMECDTDQKLFMLGMACADIVDHFASCIMETSEGVIERNGAYMLIGDAMQVILSKYGVKQITIDEKKEYVKGFIEAYKKTQK